MCGIAGLVSVSGRADDAAALHRAVSVLSHRGPDDEGTWMGDGAGLGNRRLAVLDLSRAGRQPMVSADGRYVLTFNGEIYNYLELRAELGGRFVTGTDTEVLLASLARWGMEALPRLNGMFAFALWDRRDRTMHLVRDRFGVKPLYYAWQAGRLAFASEIKSLAACGVSMSPDAHTWGTYLSSGIYDDGPATFFEGVQRVPPGHFVRFRDGLVDTARWYDFTGRVHATFPDQRPEDEVAAEYGELLLDSLRLRFRSDVPVGVCLSGGLDSSVLIGALHQLFGSDAEIRVHHFATGDRSYDETPFVKQLLAGSRYPLHVSLTSARDVPDFAETVAYFQEEPYGGIPTIAMAHLFRDAREAGTIVLLDAQGLDEQWAGYDYYTDVRHPRSVQGSHSPGVRPACISDALPRPRIHHDDVPPRSEVLLTRRVADLTEAKIPRTLRFSDRTSSQFSCELREPCLDHRLVELAFAQPPDRLVRDGTNKYLLRRIAHALLPSEIAGAPKRAVQTPQREWLRGPLRGWVEDCLVVAIQTGWLDGGAVRKEWYRFLDGAYDNSFFVWQWVSLALNELVLQEFRRLANTEADVPISASLASRCRAMP